MEEIVCGRGRYVNLILSRHSEGNSSICGWDHCVALQTSTADSSLEFTNHSFSYQPQVKTFRLSINLSSLILILQWSVHSYLAIDRSKLFNIFLLREMRLHNIILCLLYKTRSTVCIVIDIFQAFAKLQYLL
jgi:hypothetical protein